MAVNISYNQLNNAAMQSSISNQTATQAANTYDAQNNPHLNPAINSGLQMLKDMLAGDTFSGKIMQIEDNNVLLALNNGKTLLAHLSDKALVQAGQNLTFMVEDNNGSNISIKPLMPLEQQAVLINKALDAAQFPVTDTNIDIVKELLNLNMPINSDTIAQMVKQANKFPDTSLNTLANLVKLDIPVNENNIAQFEAYKSYEHSINRELNGMVKGFADMLNETLSEGVTPKGADTLFNQITDIFYGESDKGNSQRGSAIINQALGPDIINNLSNTLEQIKQQLAEKVSDRDLTTVNDWHNNIKSIDSLIGQLKDGKSTVKEFLNNISTIIKEQPDIRESLKELTSSEDFNKCIKYMIDETVKLNPSDINKEDGIKKYYKHINDVIEKAAEKISENDAGKQLSADMQSIKSNIDFMNDLNRNMTYFQMPVKFQESETNGELYVFTNKRALKAGSDNVSALLHLDMDNLGPIDIFVKLSGSNVSTNFCLESEEMLDFVYANIDKLNKRLEKLGYNFNFEMKVSESDSTSKSQSFDFVKDFIEKDVVQIDSFSQFVLDVKA